jgi:hypothetical protein
MSRSQQRLYKTILKRRIMAGSHAGKHRPNKDLTFASSLLDCSELLTMLAHDYSP